MILKKKNFILNSLGVMLVLGFVACGDDEETKENTLSGASVASCTYVVAGITSCTETRNLSEAVATTVKQTCDDASGTGATTACANKSAAPGECVQTSDTGQVTYGYQSGESVTAAVAEASCTSSEGEFTATSE